MSNEAMSWAWKAKVGAAKLVLILLADHASDHAGEDWTCFPSVERLIERSELGAATVRRHLNFLEAEGWISRKRRVRPDGRLGIFDFTIHREEAVRAELKAARAGVQPALKMSGGEGTEPALILDEAIAQNERQPPLKMSGLEPSVEPLEEPSHGARAMPAGFDEGLAAYPKSGRDRTDFPEARRRWADAVRLVGPERLVGAVRRYVAQDRDLKAGDYGAPGFHHWLERERWRPHLDDQGTIEPPRTPFAGPAEVFAAIAGALAGGRTQAEALLEGATWRAADRTVLTRTTTAADKLRQELGWRTLQTLKISFERAAPSAFAAE